MKTYISKLGVSLIALALVVAPTLALAQATLVADITTPANGVTVTVNQAVSFTSTATGGTSSKAFNWTWGDGTELFSVQNPSHTYTTTGAKTVTLRVTDSTGSTDTDTITINVTNAPTTDVVISNIQVTNITTSGATITWTTNIPATSRVIYDTVSHVGAGGTTTGVKPDYDYADSTSIDNTKVTSHSVTLSGLSANTQYFFRVLSAK